MPDDLGPIVDDPPARPPVFGSMLGWLLALALAVGTGVLGKYHLAASTELAALRLHAEVVAVEPRGETAQRPGPGEELAIMSLVQAAKIEELEEQLAEARAAAGRTEELSRDVRHAKRREERARSAEKLEEKERKKWQRRVTDAESRAKRLNVILRATEAALKSANRDLELLGRRGVRPNVRYTRDELMLNPRVR